MPASSRRRALFPAPLDPMIPTRSPSPTTRSTCSKALIVNQLSRGRRNIPLST